MRWKERKRNLLLLRMLRFQQYWDSETPEESAEHTLAHVKERAERERRKGETGRTQRAIEFLFSEGMMPVLRVGIAVLLLVVALVPATILHQHWSYEREQRASYRRAITSVMEQVSLYTSLPKDENGSMALVQSIENLEELYPRLRAVDISACPDDFVAVYYQLLDGAQRLRGLIQGYYSLLIEGLIWGLFADSDESVVKFKQESESIGNDVEVSLNRLNVIAKKYGVKN